MTFDANTYIERTADGGALVAEAVKPFVAPRAPIIDESGIALLQEILDAAKAGTVTAFAVAAKDAGFATWRGKRCYRNGDRYNLMGQLQSLIIDLDGMEEEE